MGPCYFRGPDRRRWSSQKRARLIGDIKPLHHHPLIRLHGGLLHPLRPTEEEALKQFAQALHPFKLHLVLHLLGEIGERKVLNEALNLRERGGLQIELDDVDKGRTHSQAGACVMSSGASR